MKNILFVTLTFSLLMGTISTSLAQTSFVEGTGMTVNEIIAQKEKEERNKKNVLDFMQLLVGDRDYNAAEKYMGEYIQHDPKVKGNGIAPLKEYLTTSPAFKDRPKGVKVHFYLVLAEGNYVYLQKRNNMPDKKKMVQHIFRLNDEGKIDEHWTTLTLVNVNEGVNPNPLY